MRIILIGCVQFSESALLKILELPNIVLAGIITRQSSTFHADFVSLEPLANHYNIPYFCVDDKNAEQMYNWVSEMKADILYCFGWSQLLSIELLRLPKLGSIGFHPAALPANRGRHPIIWALALGLKQTASSFFFMDETADSGDIISQEIISISQEDDAGSLYEKITLTALKQIPVFTEALRTNSHRRIPQNHDLANSWRKRGKADGRIDWRMPATGIYNLIRALAQPYIGAHLLYQEQEIKVWKSELVISEVPPNIEPGKILDIENGIVVKCGIGAIRLLEHEFSTIPLTGEYL